MRCRAVICAACCTRVRGINQCHACLKELSQRPERVAAGLPRAVVAFLVLGLIWFVFLGVCWFIQGKMAP
jgi:hypothetical protein